MASKKVITLPSNTRITIDKTCITNCEKYLSGVLGSSAYKTYAQEIIEDEYLSCF